MTTMYYNVGQIKERLKNVPDDYDIRYSRIEDIYFKEYGWDSPNVTKKLTDLCFCQDEHDESCYSDYVGIFSVIVKHDEKCVQLTAHY